MSLQRKSSDPNINRIEWHIRHERAIRDAVAEARATTGGHTGGAPTGHSYITDTTAAQAIRNAEELRSVKLDNGSFIEWPERWLTVIAAVRAWCDVDTIRAEVFRRRYKGEGYISTCREINIAQQTYSDVLGRIRDYEIKCACQAQLIKVF